MALNKDLLYGRIFDSSVAAIGITDLEGRYTIVNPAWCNYLGYSADEALRLNLNDITPLEDRNKSELNFGRLIHQEIPFIRVTRRYLKKDGNTIWADLHASVITNDKDEVCAILGIFVNIDPRVKLETELREINAKLEASNQELHAAMAELQKMARHDPLTHLYNRRVLEQSMQLEAERSIRSKRGLGVAIGDIDDFKQVNDVYGHDCGDIVLKEMATLFRDKIRTTDMVGRWGGEEFLFIFPETTYKGAMVVLERIRKAVSEMKLKCGDNTIKLTLSLGLSYQANKPQRENIVEEADKALYKAKRDGKNRIYCYQELKKKGSLAGVSG